MNIVSYGSTNGLVTMCTDRTVTTWQYLRAHCTADPVVHKMAAEVTATSGNYCQMAGRCLVIIYCITSYYYSTTNGQLQFVISAKEKLSIPFLLQYPCNIQATPTIMYCTVIVINVYIVWPHPPIQLITHVIQYRSHCVSIL